MRQFRTQNRFFFYVPHFDLIYYSKKVCARFELHIFRINFSTKMRKSKSKFPSKSMAAAERPTPKIATHKYEMVAEK